MQYCTLANLCLFLQPLYGFGSKDPARFVRAAGHADLFYVQDLDTPTGQASACHFCCMHPAWKGMYLSDQSACNLKQIIEGGLPKFPVEVGVVPHWLAIEGVQPNIPENAPVERQKLKRPRAEVAHHKVARKKQEAGTLAVSCERLIGQLPAAQLQLCCTET